MTEIVCARCGHPNSEAANYCSSCGFDIKRSLEEDTSEMQVVDPATAAPGDGAGDASLVIKRGQKAGMRFGLEGDVTTIGRHPDSDIFLDDVTVSRRHAEVRRRSDSLEVCDVGSLNGTYLNRERIDDTSTLRSGDEVQIGKFKLVFLAEDA